ncbi:MAG: hypothetical protein ACK2UW_16415 [Anaerolineales bacterium]|jgi:hypothetical protein
MQKKKRWIISLAAAVLLLALTLSACQLPASDTPTETVSEQEMLTQGAETVAVELTMQAELAIPATQTASAGGSAATSAGPSPTSVEAKPPTLTPTVPAPAATAAATDTPVPATATTAPPTASPTPPEPTATPTLAVATLTALRDTNCRQGPGGNFTWISGLRAGKTAAVFGQDSSGTWWYIQRPAGKADEYCWVWGETTEVDVDADLLPVVPPYPPQLSPVTSQWYYTIDAVNVHNCGVPTAFLMIQNSGFTTLASSRVEIRNASTGDILDDTISNTPYTSLDRDCEGGFAVLPPDQTGFVRGRLGGVLSGDVLVANVSLCKEANLTGPCYFSSVTFVMP